MKRGSIAAALASAALLIGCGNGDAQPTETAGAPTESAVTSPSSEPVPVPTTTAPVEPEESLDPVIHGIDPDHLPATIGEWTLNVELGNYRRGSLQEGTPVEVAVLMVEGHTDPAIWTDAMEGRFDIDGGQCGVVFGSPVCLGETETYGVVLVQAPEMEDSVQIAEAVLPTL